MANIYEDGTYLNANKTWHAEDSPWKASQIEKIIRKNSLSLDTICEIGCGAGEILSCLQQTNDSIEFFGYEISPQAYEICSRKSNNKLTFKLADLLAEDKAYFDLVMAIDVFEHVEDYFGFLRMLKTKGEYFIFHIPLDISVQSVLRSQPILEARKSIGHIHYFTKETAIETLLDTGFEIVDSFYTAGTLELANRGWKTRLLSFPRKLAFFLEENFAVRLLGGYSLLVLAK